MAGKKKLNYFEFMSNNFKFSRVRKNVESWFVYTNNHFWIVRPYFLTDMIKPMAL